LTPARAVPDLPCYAWRKAGRFDERRESGKIPPIFPDVQATGGIFRGARMAFPGREMGANGVMG
jgi:hypothetical protein